MSKKKRTPITVSIKRWGRRVASVAKAKRAKMHGLPNSYPMDRNQAARLRAYARMWSVKRRQPGQHGPGPITRAFHDVLHGLITFANSKTGSCFPSYEKIAGRAHCAQSTVGEAIKMLEFAGVIVITNRIKRKGERVIRTSNAYVFKDMGPNTEKRSGNQAYKDSSKYYAAKRLDVAEVNTKYVIRDPKKPLVVLDPRNMVEAALAKLAGSMGLVDSVA